MHIKRKYFILFIVSLILIDIFAVFIHFQRSQPKPDLVKLEAGRIANYCQKYKYREECYSIQFGRLTEILNMDFSKKTLLALQDIDPEQSRGCHLIAHYISLAETKKHPEDWKELLSKQNFNICTGGFIHGVLEAHMSMDNSFRLDGPAWPLLCGQFSIESGAKRSCFHNLGHILLVQEQNSIANGVKICSQIKDYTARYECLSGLFMENLTRLNLKAHGLAEKIPWDQVHTEEVKKLCNQYRGLPQQACWKEISYMFATLYKTNPKKVFEACYQAPDKTMADACYIYGAGNMVVFSFFKPAYLTEVCSVYNEKDQ